MIDEKDIEIAKLRGQVEQLEKMLKQLMTAPQPPPQFIPYPVPSLPTCPPPAQPWINPQPWELGPYWYVNNNANCAGAINPTGLVYTNVPGFACS